MVLPSLDSSRKYVHKTTLSERIRSQEYINTDYIYNNACMLTCIGRGFKECK